MIKIIIGRKYKDSLRPTEFLHENFTRPIQFNELMTYLNDKYNTRSRVLALIYSKKD